MACYHADGKEANRFAFADLLGHVRIGESSIQVFLKGGEIQTVRFRSSDITDAMESFLVEITAKRAQIQCPKCRSLIAYKYSTMPREGPCKKCGYSLRLPHKPNTFVAAALFEDFASTNGPLAQWKYALPEVASAYRPSGKVSADAVLWMLLGLIQAVLLSFLASGVVGVIYHFVGISNYLSANLRYVQENWSHIPLRILLFSFVLPFVSTLAFRYVVIGIVSGSTIASVVKKGKNRSQTFPALLAAFAAGIVVATHGFIAFYMLSSENAVPERSGALLVVADLILGSAIAIVSACFCVDESTGDHRFCERCGLHMDSSRSYSMPRHLLQNFACAMYRGRLANVIALYVNGHEGSRDQHKGLYSCPKCGEGYADFFVDLRFKYLEDDEKRCREESWRFASLQLTSKGVEAFKNCTMLPSSTATDSSKSGEVVRDARGKSMAEHASADEAAVGTSIDNEEQRGQNDFSDDRR